MWWINKNKTIFSVFFVFILCTYGGFIFQGCQTLSRDKDKKVIKAGETIPFIPLTPTVNIEYIKGLYPSIFNSTSSASWYIPSDTTTNSPVIVKLILDSSFQDMSIAYDSVRLKGFNVSLLLPNGQQIKPTQVIINSQLEELPVGTLRRFKREVTLTFPLFVNEIVVPKEGVESVKIALILEGYDTTFCFAWSPQPAPVEIPISMKLQEGKECIKTKTKTFKKKMLNWTHTFD